MSLPSVTPEADVLDALRALATLRWIAPFGHVSIRTSQGAIITATLPPGRQSEATLIPIDRTGLCAEDRLPDRPIEAFLHAAIYEARPDVGAICRAHPPAASAWAAGVGLPPLATGLGGFARTIARHDDPDLVHNLEAGQAVAVALGGADAVFLRANGVVTVGSDVAEAAARMWSLEQRCATALSRLPLTPLTGAELEQRARWFDREIARTWAWLRAMAG